MSRDRIYYEITNDDSGSGLGIFDDPLRAGKDTKLLHVCGAELRRLEMENRRRPAFICMTCQREGGLMSGSYEEHQRLFKIIYENDPIDGVSSITTRDAHRLASAIIVDGFRHPVVEVVTTDWGVSYGGNGTFESMGQHGTRESAAAAITFFREDEHERSSELEPMRIGRREIRKYPVHYGEWEVDGASSD